MKLRLLFALIFIKYLVAQDVEVPGDLLENKSTSDKNNSANSTTNDNEASTIQSIVPPIEIVSTTTAYYYDDSQVDSWIVDPYQNIPMLDRIANAFQHYDYSQCQNPYPDYTIPYPPFIQPPYENHNNNIYTIPPVYDTSTTEPDVEEKIECPIGFIKSNSSCIPLNSNKCPNGYEWKDERCVLSQTTCPLNFDFDGTSCVQNQICPSNHIWKDGKCVSPVPLCPPGWKWNNEKCEIINIECQSGFVLKGSECVYEKITCPNGYNLVNDQCIKPIAVCSPGFELLESGFCKQINTKCPPGTVLKDGKCERVIITCPDGYEKIGDQCYKIHETTTKPPPPSTTTQNIRFTTTTAPPIINPPTTQNPPPSICPEGFIFYNGQCYRCPLGYNFSNGKCLKNVPPCKSPTQPPITDRPDSNIPKLPPCSHSNPINIVNNIEPVNNTIHNINNITHPVSLNNVNENNIYVYMDTECANGKIRTTIIKNNQTIIGCEDSDNDDSKLEQNTKKPDDPKTDEAPKKERCCEIVTPRQCKKRFTNQWMCTHRRYKHCGNVCIANRLYVKPPTTVWNNQILTIAPPPVQKYIKPCFGEDCPSVDCTGCIDGSYNCSAQCYTYPCFGDGCTFINQDQLCETVNDHEFC